MNMWDHFGKAEVKDNSQDSPTPPKKKKQKQQPTYWHKNAKLIAYTQIYIYTNIWWI